MRIIELQDYHLEYISEACVEEYIWIKSEDEDEDDPQPYYLESTIMNGGYDSYFEYEFELDDISYDGCYWIEADDLSNLVADDHYQVEDINMLIVANGIFYFISFDDEEEEYLNYESIEKTIRDYIFSGMDLESIVTLLML